MSEPTHILHWVPPYVDGSGTWELQDIASYEAGIPQPDPAWMIEDDHRNIDAAEYTDWIASMVGYPVTAEPWINRITWPRALRFCKREPAFLIASAEVTS